MSPSPPPPDAHIDGIETSFALDPDVVFLNHGSFGACPIPVLERQAELRALLERQPVRFFNHLFEPLLDAARHELAAFVCADPEGLVFVPNATHAVNTVLRSLTFNEGDELLTTDHEYNACKNALDFVAARSGARVVVAEVPFPIEGPDAVVDAVLRCVTPKTRLALLDHVTSPTALVIPLAGLVAELRARGVETLVDGAHAVGMIPLDLEGLGAAYYTSNCHKWLCAPKGCAFLHVRTDLRDAIVPLSISHGMNTPRSDRSRFRRLFDWTGTYDPSPHLVIPEVLRFLSQVLPGGIPALGRRNHALAVWGRDVLCDALDVATAAPASMLGSTATLPLPRNVGNEMATRSVFVPRSPSGGPDGSIPYRGPRTPVAEGRRSLLANLGAGVQPTGALRETRRCAPHPARRALGSVVDGPQPPNEPRSFFRAPGTSGGKPSAAKGAFRI